MEGAAFTIARSIWKDTNERPGDRRAAKKSDKFAPRHV